MITLIIQPQPQGMAPAGINFVPTQPQEPETLWKSKLLVFPWDNIPAHKSINTELSLQGLIPLHPRSPESPDQSLWTCSILPSLEQECRLIFKSCLWMRPETIPKPLVNIPQCPPGEKLSDPKALQAKFPPALSPVGAEGSQLRQLPQRVLGLNSCSLLPMGAGWDQSNDSMSWKSEFTCWDEFWIPWVISDHSVSSQSGTSYKYPH